MKNFKFAFTLAEVLITLSILGVIAAITIPNIVKDLKKRTYVTQLQRWYSDMQSTIDEFVIYNDNKMETFDSGNSYLDADQSRFIEFLDTKYGDLYGRGLSNKNYSKESKILLKDKNGEVNYKNLIGESGPSQYPDFNIRGAQAKVYKTKYGSIFGLYFIETSIGMNWVVFVDVNGAEHGPNILGRDTFNFYISNNSKALIPRATSSENYFEDSDSTYTSYDIGCSMSSTYESNGTICAKKIMEDNWKMNY